MAKKLIYWVKLDVNFFNSNSKISYLMKLPHGSDYVCLYIQLVLISSQNNGKLVLNFANKEEPYTVDDIKKEMPYFSKQRINKGLSILEELGLIFYKNPDENDDIFEKIQWKNDEELNENPSENPYDFEKKRLENPYDFKKKRNDLEENPYDFKKNQHENPSENREDFQKKITMIFVEKCMVDYGKTPENRDFDEKIENFSDSEIDLKNEKKASQNEPIEKEKENKSNKENKRNIESLELKRKRELEVTDLEKEKNIKKKSSEEDGASASVYFPKDQALERAFQEYLNMRRKVRKPMTDYAINILIKDLERLATVNGQFDNDLAIQMLDKATSKNWMGVYPLSEKKRADSPAQNDNMDEAIAKVKAILGEDYGMREVKENDS